MSLDFCTRVARRARGFGYEKKVARRIAQFCYLAMTFVCGLFGLFLGDNASIDLIAGSGIMHTAGTRAVTPSPAFSCIRR